MFTGLVQAVGSVVELVPTDSGRRLSVGFGDWGHAPAPGDSIAVSGVCLTVVAVGHAAGHRTLVAFDVVPETLSRTTLGSLEPGARVNLEHALSASGLLGGHMVQGHVDAIGRVHRVDRDEGWRVRIGADDDTMACTVPKGSVAVDGVSLTVAAAEVGMGGAGWFEVALIPETLERTTLAVLEPGHEVNIETDMIARTVVHYARHFLRRPAEGP